MRVKYLAQETKHNVPGQGSNPEISTVTMRLPCLPEDYVIYQTQETVFHQDIQTPRSEYKIRRAAK